MDDAASTGIAALNNGLLSMERNLKSTDKAFQGMNLGQLAALGVFAGSVIALGLLGGALIYSVDQAGKMEQIFLKLQLSTSGTTAEFARMKGVLIDTADGSIFSLNDMGDAMYQMGLKGYDANDMANSLIVSVKNLAEAIRTDPVSAAKLLGTTLKEFNIPAKDSAATVDLLQYAFEHGVPSANKLETALSRVGPMARQMKMPLDEVVIAIDTMSQNMNSGADAGGMLRYTLQSMYEPTTAQAKAQSQLGLVTISSTTPAFTQFEAALSKTSKTNAGLVTGFDGSYASMVAMYGAAQKVGQVPMGETFLKWVSSMGQVKSAFFDAKGNVTDFMGAIKKVADSIKNLPDDQKLSAMKQMFNIKSGQGAGVMINEIDKMLAAFKKLKDSHDNAGVAAHRAEQQEHSFSGSLAGLQTSIQTTAGLIGGPLRDVLAGMFYNLNHALGPLVNFVKQQPQIGAAFFAVAGTAAIAGLIISAAFIPAIAPILMLAGIAAATVVAILALGLAGAFLAAHWKEIVHAVQPVIDAFHRVIDTIVNFMKPVIAGIGKDLAFLGKMFDGMATDLVPLKAAFAQLMQALAPLMPYIKMLGQAIGVVLLGALVVVAGIIIAVAVALVFAWTAAAKGLINIVTGIVHIFTGLVLIVTGVIQLIAAIISAGFLAMSGHSGAAMANIAAAWHTLWTGIEVLVQGIWHVIVGLFQASVGVVIAIIVGFVSAIINFFTHLADVLVGHSIIPDMLKLILQWFVQIFAQILSRVTGFISSVISFFQNMGHSAVSAVQAAVSFIENAFSSGLSIIVGAVQGGISRVVSFFQNLGGQLGGAARSAWSAVQGAFQSGISTVAGIASSLGGRIMGVLSGLGGQMFSWGANAMSMFASGLASMIGAVLGPIQQAASAIAGLMAHHSPAEKGPMQGDDQWMPNMMKMHADGIRKHIPTVAKAAADVALGIQSSLTLQSTQSVNANFTSGRPLVANLYVDGKQMAKTVINNFTHDLSMNGFSRSLL